MFDARAIFAVLFVPIGAAADTLRDPMRPYHARSEAPERLERERQRWALSAVLVSDDRRVAIVNGRAVGEGDRIGRAKVRRIFRRGVELELDGRTVTLKLNAKERATFDRSLKK